MSATKVKILEGYKVVMMLISNHSDPPKTFLYGSSMQIWDFLNMGISIQNFRDFLNMRIFPYKIS